ncbi:MAG: glycosyltransferase, partial [bacterium]
MVKVLAIIPTYNESENVAELLFRLDKVRDRLNDRCSIDILIVDDSSPDKTAELVNSLGIQNLSVLTRSKKSGLGPAYLAGFNLGLKGDYHYFVQMDADLS